MRKSIVFTLMFMLSLLLGASYVPAGFAEEIRKDIAKASSEERKRFRDAIIALHTSCHYPGQRSDSPAGGVSCWFKQDEIHARTHVHNSPAFLPWHRELLNRFETQLKQIDPTISLYYWDWTIDPHWMFTSDFMGNANGQAGDPWLHAGFYDPTAPKEKCRSDNEFDPNNNPFDPPCNLTRGVQKGAPVTPEEEHRLLAASTFEEFDSLIVPLHNRAHGWIGGSIGNAHTSFRDPFVFLLHSNIDRLFALWQRQVGHPERLNPNLVYGSYSNTKGDGNVQGGDPSWGILSPLEPWAGPEAQTAATGIILNVQAARPWAPPENQQVVKNSKHPSVVSPPLYQPRGFGNYDVNSARGLAGLDPGYAYFRVMADVDGDGRADYCRFVGNPGAEFLSCALAKEDGTFGNYDVNSAHGLAGLDPGYAYFRVMADVDGDGRADYCRFVGNPGAEFLSCALAKKDGTFGNYDVNSAHGLAGLDPGYAYFRVMADVDGDGRADYCRFVGNPGAEFLSCALAKKDGTFGNYDVNSAHGLAGLDPGYAYFRVMADVDGDGRADYCRFVGNPGAEFLSCALAKKVGNTITFGNYDVNSARGLAGLDPGYAYFRVMADVDGDGRADYCRFVGSVGHEFLSCALAKSNRTFGNFDVESIPNRAGFDTGYAYFRIMADVDGDGQADYCRFVGNPGAEFLSCATTHVLDYPD